MKTVALLIYAEATKAVVAECRRQIDAIPREEFTFEVFVNPDLDAAWREAGEKDFYIWVHGLVTPVDGAIYSLLDNSSFLGDRALLVGTVQDGSGNIVSGGFGPPATGPGDSRGLQDVRRAVRPHPFRGV